MESGAQDHASSRKVAADDAILNALDPKILDWADKDLVTENDKGMGQLFSTMILVRNHMPLPERTVKGLEKLSNSKKNGFKELGASELLLEAGYDLSQRAVTRAISMANGTLTDWPYAEDKQKLAIVVVQTYQRKIFAERKTQ